MWSTFDDNKKVKLIKAEHVKGDLSIRQMAEKYATYPNKISRDAKRLGIAIDNKSDSIKRAYRTGTLEHPTKGKVRSDEVKRDIADGKKKHWNGLDEKSKDVQRKRMKQLYDNQTTKMHQNPKKVEKIREAAKSGSKLELYLYTELQKLYTGVTHQLENELRNELFHIDLFINPNIAIEVDGPSHFASVWGDDTLNKTIEKDKRKVAACMEKGFYFISVLNDRKFSISFGSEILRELVPMIDKIISGKSGKKLVCRVK